MLQVLTLVVNLQTFNIGKIIHSELRGSAPPLQVRSVDSTDDLSVNCESVITAQRCRKNTQGHLTLKS